MMDNGNLNQDLIRYTAVSDGKKDGGKYGAIEKEKQNGVDSGEEGEQAKRPMGDKERHVMLMVMGVVSFLGYTQFSMVGPFYPQYAREMNASSLTIGIVVGSFELAVLVSSPLWGSALTTIGGKPMYIGGVVGTAAFAVMFGFLYLVNNPRTFVALSITLRTLMGLCDGAYSVATYALIIYAFPDKVASSLGILQAFQATGTMVGPIIGSALYEAGGFYLPFVVVSGILVIVGLSIISLIPSYSDNSVRTYSACRLLTIPTLVLCASFQTTVSAIVAMSDAILALHLQGFGLSPLQIGAVFLAGPGTYILFTPLNGYCADKKTWFSYYHVIIAFFVAGLSLLLLGPAPFFHLPKSPLWLVIVSLLLFGSSASALVVAISLMFRSASEAGCPETLETYGLVSGYLRSSAALGGASGAIGGGLVYGSFGFKWGATAAGIVLWIQVILMIILVIVRHYCKKEETKEDTLALTENTENTSVNKTT